MYCYFFEEDIVYGFKKIEFKDPLVLPTKESHFLANSTLHKKSEAVGMRIPQGYSIHSFKDIREEDLADLE